MPNTTKQQHAVSVSSNGALNLPCPLARRTMSWATFTWFDSPFQGYTNVFLPAGMYGKVSISGNDRIL
jgi:hypothetical protein